MHLQQQNVITTALKKDIENDAIVVQLRDCQVLHSDIDGPRGTVTADTPAETNAMGGKAVDTGQSHHYEELTTE